MRRRVASVVCAVCVALACVLALAGCAWFGEPASTEDLLVRYAANERNDDCAADVVVDVGLSFFGFRAKVPLEARADVAGHAVHATCALDLASLGDMRRDFELYAQVDGTTLTWYARVVGDEGTPWRRSMVNLPTAIDVKTLVELLSDAQFSRMADDEDPQVRYELTISAAALLGAVADKGAITTSFGELDREAAEEMLGDSRVHVYFNEDCLIRSISLDLYFDHEDRELAPRPVSVSVGCEAVMDGYGSVDEAAVALPQEVRDGAQDTDDPLFIDDILRWIGGKLA